MNKLVYKIVTTTTTEVYVVNENQDVAAPEVNNQKKLSTTDRIFKLEVGESFTLNSNERGFKGLNSTASSLQNKFNIGLTVKSFKRDSEVVSKTITRIA